MKVVILAGGRGTRLGKETDIRPKPMVAIGRRPILWHIMKIYSTHGYEQFVVACGYKGHIIKEYFHNYAMYHGDFRVSVNDGSAETLNAPTVDWEVELVDTGLDTMTGGRIARLEPLLADETFMVTYGDGVADIDVRELVRFHRSHDRLATITAVRPPSRFGALDLDGDQVRLYSEKPQAGEGWINGGFFVFEPGVFGYLEGDDCILERRPLEELAADGQLMAYRHEGYWQPMDTVRDKNRLEALWDSDDPPWRIWS